MRRRTEIERLAGRVLCAGFPGRELPDGIRARLDDDALGGVILFKRNLGTIEEVAALSRSVAERVSPSPIVAIDQEGGRVARLGPPVLRLPPMRELGVRGEPAFTERCARALGAQLAMLGINLDFAPVLDVDTNPDNPVIGDRSFGRDVRTVIAHGLAFARGLEASGVAACGKHFPGHGDTDLDSHLALPRVRHDRARLEAVEFAPFRSVVGHVSAIMTAHVVFDALDPGIPATLSRRIVTGILREQLRFEGVVVSDDLEMRALSDRGSFGENAVAAIEAGCDLLLVCSRIEALEEVAASLAARAHSSPAFEDRLREADARVRRLRTEHPPRLRGVDGLAETLRETARTYGAALEPLER